MNIQLKMKKTNLIKGKIAKSSATFHKNKPNLKNIKIGVSSFEKSKYEILSAGSGEKTNPNKPNLSQNKANSNPIMNWAIINISSFMTSKYVKSDTLPGRKTNPNKPNLIGAGFLPG